MDPQQQMALPPHPGSVNPPTSSGLPELDRRQLIQVCKYLKENTTLSAKDIAKAYSVSLRTMYRWLAMPDPPDNTAPVLRKAGKPPKCSLELEDEIFNWLCEEPSRRQIDAVRMVHERHGITITQQTVSNILKRHSDTSARLAATGGIQQHGGVALLGMAATAQPLYQQAVVGDLLDPSQNPGGNSYVMFQQLHGNAEEDHDAASAAASAAAAAAMQAAAAAGALVSPEALSLSNIEAIGGAGAEEDEQDELAMGEQEEAGATDDRKADVNVATEGEDGETKEQVAEESKHRLRAHPSVAGH
ncbi:hypothetical protein M427DRAFT_68009 [Gonapodya prolifera JEL478]|uniref:Uncharacterized protein n=1 Tax=Gonapodya prolifera (strain JEL478) TaxID=1344416 RepID=A0A139ANB2_GONPJ|nr:hypothetical protein M427DRAFT_68009 [Gonapodya prolifera JEL478]|eukprot:KXS18226.1 hypothetical protein M427DRAFT_68009 [Gonapodya prolifera JEL478]